MLRSSTASGWLFAGLTLACAPIASAGGTQAAALQPPIPAQPGMPPKAIVLPQKIVAGETATLAVLDSTGRLVPGAEVELAGGRKITTDATGRATFTAPSQAGAMIARMGDDVAFTATIIPAPATGAPNSGAATGGAGHILFPHVLALGDRFTLEGAGFGGDAQLDRIQLGDQDALVLAASSVALVALPNPHTTLGRTQLTLKVAGLRLAQLPVTVVSLSVDGPAKALAAGEKGALTVEVNGTTERVIVEVRNLSPDVVAMPQGTLVQVPTSGGASNFARIELSGVAPGDYAVSARIVPAMTALP